MSKKKSPRTAIGQLDIDAFNRAFQQSPADYKNTLQLLLKFGATVDVDQLGRFPIEFQRVLLSAQQDIARLDKVVKFINKQRKTLEVNDPAYMKVRDLYKSQKVSIEQACRTVGGIDRNKVNRIRKVDPDWPMKKSR